MQKASATKRLKALRLAILLLGAMVATVAPVSLSAETCAPPAGFIDTPHPEIAPVEKLVSHTEEIDIDRPLGVVLDETAKTKLEDAIDRKNSLPGVSGTYMLTGGEFGQPGSRRLTCLTDGASLVEQVLIRQRKPDSFQFRYVVWNYTTERARPILYGLGEFLYSDIGGGRTHVQWTYSFQLNRHRFPGYLGPWGDFLFRVGFLDRDYAQMMRNTLAGNKARADTTKPPDNAATASEPPQASR